MKRGKSLLNVLIFVFPLICGTIGFAVMEKTPFLDSVFRCVTMYVLNYGETPPNILVEIARWTAPAVSAYSVLLIASQLRTRIITFFRSRNADSVAVYGPDEKTASLLAALGKRGVSGGSAPMKTGKHILLWDEEENLRFYEQNKEQLAGKDVYIQSESLPAQTAAGANLHVFCPEETAARLFWKKNCIYEKSCACGHRMKIVVIGFGRLGTELLSLALQNNIFSPEQSIEYHIFGGDPVYLKLRGALCSVEDLIVFHSEPWEDCVPLLESAEQIIVAEQADQTALLSRLLLAVKEKTIDVFTANRAGLEILDEKNRIRLFAWQEEAFRPENILNETLCSLAKAINLRYAFLYNGVAETPDNLETEWKKLDTFTRYSNISSADYHGVRLKMLQTMGEPTDPDSISAGCMELLSELEHMRWCRYHWLNNWSYGIPENGKAKDKTKRIHVDLIPYRDLAESEKQKDRDTVHLLLELNGQEA